MHDLHSYCLIILKIGKGVMLGHKEEMGQKSRLGTPESEGAHSCLDGYTAESVQHEARMLV